MLPRGLSELVDVLPVPLSEGRWLKMPGGRIARELGRIAAVLDQTHKGETAGSPLTTFDDKADESVVVPRDALLDALALVCPLPCRRCGDSWVVDGAPCASCAPSSPRGSVRVLGAKFNEVVANRLLYWALWGAAETKLEVIDPTGFPVLRATSGERCIVLVGIRPDARVAATELELPKPPAPTVTPDGRCCACGQHVKTYRRSINATMASALVAFARESAHKLNGAQLMTWPVGMAPMPPFIHAPAFFARINHPAQRGGDFVRFRHYGFIVPMPGDRGDGSHRNGWWRITDAGIAFARGETTAPRYLSVYNNTVVGESEERVTIRDVLGESFDYTDLAARPATPAEVEKTK